MKNIFIISILLFSLSTSFGQTVLPNKVLFDMDGKEVNAQTIGKDGKPFAICFWAVWNKTCLLELNNLMENYQDWHDEYGVNLYAISIDEKKRIPRAKAYVDAHEWKYNVLFDLQGKMENAMKINGVPHLMLFNANGEMVWQEHDYNAGLEKHFLDEVHKLK